MSKLRSTIFRYLPHEIDSIVIASTKDYNTNHPPGSNLANLFNSVVPDHANGIYYEKYALQEYLLTKSHVPSELTLILTEQPTIETDFEFSVKYYQNEIADNDYVEFTTPKIVINHNY